VSGLEVGPGLSFASSAAPERAGEKIWKMDWMAPPAADAHVMVKK